MTEDLQGTVALISGASRGIGAAIADALGLAGAVVVGTATSDAGAQAIGARFSSHGIAGRGAVLDVNDAEGVIALVKDVTANEGAPTVLVNNAGITLDGLLLRLGEDEWNKVLSTNLSSVYRLSKACLRGMMKKRYGRIINIGSVVGTIGNPGQTSYAAAKAGMVGFSKSLAREVGSRGITVNTVAPGYVATDMTEALDEAQRSRLESQIPLGRLGTAGDIAAAVVFLASPSAGYITGETIHVNGGMSMA